MTGHEPRYPGGDPKVFRLSHSTFVTVQKCGVRYLLDRSVKHKRSTMPMVRGLALAEVARADNLSKLEKGKGISLLDATGIGIAAYEERVGRYEIPEKRAEILAGKDDTKGIVRAYMRQVSPLTKDIVAAERAIVARLGDMELVGRPDVIAAQGVGDYKTGKMWTQAQVDYSRQLSSYGFLHKALIGAYPERVWIDSIFKLRGVWQAIRLWSDRTEDDYKALWNCIVRVRAAIEKEVFVPAPEGAWYCSPKWCGHWHICPCVNSRRR